MRQFQRARTRDGVRPFDEFDAEPEHAARPVLQGGPAKLPADLKKRDAVVAAFKHAWMGYERDAFGDDDYHPIRKQGSNLSFTGGMGYMIADAIDTMYIMGLDDEYKRARKWVASSLTFDRDAEFSTFETTIRVFGGLLSTYYLSGDQIFLTKAKDLGDRLMFAFNSPSGLALSSVNFKTGRAVGDHGFPGHISTAEAATLQLEFRYLAHLTGNTTYWTASEKVIKVIKDGLMKPPLVPIYMDYTTGKFSQSDIRLGSRADSYYEYLLKDWLQTSRTEGVYREMYDDAMAAIHDNLVQYTPKSHLLYTAEMPSSRSTCADCARRSHFQKAAKQDHLVCFLGGSLMLGATDGAHADVPPTPEQLGAAAKRDWKAGTELIRTCMETHKTKTGLSPEISYFRTELADDDWYIKNRAWDARYLLRPETVESLFLGWRLTGDQQYRDWGWQVFSAIDKHCKIASGGYATVLDVDELPVKHDDKMETFFLAETLKYLYLLFADSSVLPLTDVVFNTEAHPFPVFKPTIRTGFS
ncbi:glycoside hydrolase [Exidia glandulosa HHB12029]|uniref:alpha-1,2-Mannosidase n=1 Tax=Exidia glandulosa HHB12029 TaxID=1314781 RepID=A0A165IQD2_EXIGL|nr:glycoside hydrolase [Exidia glandulosa HHB12029]